MNENPLIRRILPAAAILAAALVGTALAVADDTGAYAAAVAAEDRLPGDYDRDAGRKPATVLAFLGAGPGDTVLDLFAGGGYYTELLARVVGPDGRVVTHTNTPYLKYTGEEFIARYQAGRLPNVDIVVADNNRLRLDPGSLDAILVVLAYHDVYHVNPDDGWPPIDKPKLLGELFAGLKPGGVVVVVDHYAAEGSPPETGNTTHRIDPAIVFADFEAAGFRRDGASDALRNPDDDYTKIVFDPSVRGRTDRFLLRFRKPE